ncbi:2-isopropylmalate synthase (Alpha-isopropylmalate synthase) (Alpha-IPM synthetase), partial [Coemansia sp. BCRC 34490]
QTYEIIRPEDVGVTSGNLALGKHSGRHAFKTKLEELGYAGAALSDAQFQAAFGKFKQLADAKKTGVTDGDLHALVADARGSSSSGTAAAAAAEEQAIAEESSSSNNSAHPPRFTLKQMQVFTGIGVTPTATVTLHDAVEAADRTDAALAANGPIEAVFSVIQRITGLAIDLLSFNVSATSEGQETLGKVAVRIARAGGGDAADSAAALAPSGAVPKFSGLATNVDIITASANAYVAALNRLVAHDARDTRASHKDRNVDI